MEQFAPRDNDVVLDTSVLMDCLFEDRAGHENAVRMACELAAQDVTAFVPAHSFFELVSAVSCHRRVDQEPLALGALGKALPFEWVIVTIDLAFAEEYLIAPAAAGVLIDLKGGDMIFVALALRHNLTLVTGDKKMATIAAHLGVRTLRVLEYLEVGDNHSSRSA